MRIIGIVCVQVRIISKWRLPTGLKVSEHLLNQENLIITLHAIIMRIYLMVIYMIYLDYAASTPIDSRVLDAMMPYFSQEFGNPSSIHRYGQNAEAAVENARISLANLLNCQPDEIIFTSGGSESDNLALRGIALARRRDTGANHILVGPVEHHAIKNTAIQLKEVFGFDVEFLPTNEYGITTPEDVKKRIRPNTAVVSIIHGNNEIGTINPIEEIGEICRQHNIPLHTDAVQSAAHLPIDLASSHIDALSIGAHKFYGPKGVGLLYLRKDVPLIPTQTGGSQENNRRAGTSNVPYIVGLAKAYEIARNEMETQNKKLQVMRDHLIGSVLEAVPDSIITGHPQQRLPNHASFAFKHLESNTLLMLLDTMGFACASGSACKTGNPLPSDVLEKIGLSADWTRGSLRVTLGRWTTEEEITAFLHALPEAVAKARHLYATQL